MDCNGASLWRHSGLAGQTGSRTAGRVCCCSDQLTLRPADICGAWKGLPMLQVLALPAMHCAAELHVWTPWLAVVLAAAATHRASRLTAPSTADEG